VGGIVVVAAAIVFIPELLSGPKRVAPTEASTNSSEGATRSYTIDLEHKPATPAVTAPAAAEVTTSAPPPEEPVDSHTEQIPAGSNSPMPEKSVAAKESQVSPPPSAAPAEAPRATNSAVSEPEKPKPQPPARSARANSGWAVQVGSFGTSSSAEHLAQQFVQQGYRAYTQPVQVGGKTLYRVRLGPAPDRGEAEALLKKIKPDQPHATLVSEP